MEKVDIYNRNREKTNKIKQRNELKNGEYRISAHIWIVNAKKELLIQKRTMNSKKSPNMWSQTAGGVLAEEDSKEAVKRESKEELDLEVNDDEIYYIGSYIRKKDIVDVWLVKKEIEINKLKLQANEVADVKLVSFEKFDNMIKSGIVVPSINPSYLLLKNYFNNYMQE